MVKLCIMSRQYDIYNDCVLTSFSQLRSAILLNSKDIWTININISELSLILQPSIVTYLKLLLQFLQSPLIEVLLTQQKAIQCFFYIQDMLFKLLKTLIDLSHIILLSVSKGIILTQLFCVITSQTLSKLRTVIDISTYMSLICTKTNLDF